MKITHLLAKSLTKDYEVFIFCAAEVIPLYIQEEGISYLQTQDIGSWEKPFARYMVLLGIDIFIGSLNCLSYFINLYCLIKDYGIKCIAWNHEDYFFTKQQRKYYEIGESRKPVFQQLDAVVWINKASKVVYDEIGENGLYIQDCIENNESSAEYSKKEPYCLIAVGRYKDIVKRFDRLLQAFAKIYQQFPTAKLYVAGNVSLDACLPALDFLSVKHKMSMLHIPFESIEFLGWLEDLSPYYKKSVLQLCTSQSEGFGLVIPEAAVQGVPTISFSNGGADGIIVDGENGYIVRTIDEMVEKVKMLFSNPKKLEYMSEQSKVYAKEYER